MDDLWIWGAILVILGLALVIGGAGCIGVVLIVGGLFLLATQVGNIRYQP